MHLHRQTFTYAYILVRQALLYMYLDMWVYMYIDTYMYVYLSMGVCTRTLKVCGRARVCLDPVEEFCPGREECGYEEKEGGHDDGRAAEKKELGGNLCVSFREEEKKTFCLFFPQASALPGLETQQTPSDAQSEEREKRRKRRKKREVILVLVWTKTLPEFLSRLLLRAESIHGYAQVHLWCTYTTQDTYCLVMSRLLDVERRRRRRKPRKTTERKRKDWCFVSFLSDASM